MLKKLLIILKLLIIISVSQISAQHKKDSLTLTAKIQNLINNGNYQKAENFCLKYLSDNPNYDDVRFFLGVSYIRQDKKNKAKEEFQKVVYNNSDYTDAWLMLGNIAYWNDKNEKATKYYEKAMSSGYNENLYLNKARAHFRLEQIKQARELTEKVLEKDEKNKKAQKLNDDLDLYRGNKNYKEKNYSIAIPFFKHYLKLYPDINSVRFKLSKSYYALNKYDSALFHLKTIYQNDSTNQGALRLMQNIYLIKEDYRSALKYINKLLTHKPKDEKLLIRKAQILKKSEKYNDANYLTSDILKLNPENEDAKNLKYELAPHLYPNSATLFYRLDFFDEIDPYNLAYFQYGRQIDDDKFLGRFNVAHWSDTTGFQLESDYYMNFEKSYLYFNLGVSNNVLSPRFRIGTEYFRSFDYDFGGSLGYKFLNFDNNNVNLFTASVSKYWGEFKFGYRYYFVPVSNKVYSTHVISARRYFDHGTYLSLKYIWGKSHDESYIIESDFYQFTSQSFRLEFFKRITSLWSFQINATYIIEEFSSDNKRNRYSFGFMLNRYF